jgi:hypothetical protein
MGNSDRGALAVSAHCLPLARSTNEKKDDQHTEIDDERRRVEPTGSRQANER